MAHSLSNHPFHLVTPSPWPILTSICILSMFMNMIQWFNSQNFLFTLMSLISLIMCMTQWWRDVSFEAFIQGCHSKYVMKNIQLGMILFIISELFFFISIFWSYFHFTLAPSIEIGNMWPPNNIISFNPYNIPLLNTLILITSGFSISWSHNSLINKNFNQSKNSLLFTIMLGSYFSLIQMYEYYNAPFTISDSVYGSIFFLSTGFHGIHVIIGTIFLTICLIRMIKSHFSPTHHLGYEAAIWYWHFVDIIWLFLYSWIYWWSF